MDHKIGKIDVHLVSAQAPAGLADATRKVETIGFVIVRVTTDQGLEGIGVTYHEVGGEATREVIRRNMAPRLIGRDPLETEAIWQEMFGYLRGIGRKGLMFCALSAVDIALWDLKGKIVDLPLSRLLGGDRTRMPVYASGGWTSYDDDQLVDEMKGMVARGFSAIKFKVGFDGGQRPARDVERVRKVREAVGPDIRLLVDANNCFDAASAIQLANRIREFDITLFEEPVFADDIPGLARFRRGTDIPLATGEHEYTTLRRPRPAPGRGRRHRPGGWSARRRLHRDAEMRGVDPGMERQVRAARDGEHPPPARRRGAEHLHARAAPDVRDPSRLPCSRARPSRSTGS